MVLSTYGEVSRYFTSSSMDIIELEEYFSFNRSNIKCRTALFLILLRDLVHCWFLLRDLLHRKYIVHLLY